MGACGSSVVVVVTLGGVVVVFVVVVVTVPPPSEGVSSLTLSPAAEEEYATPPRCGADDFLDDCLVRAMTVVAVAPVRFLPLLSAVRERERCAAAEVKLAIVFFGVAFVLS